MVLTKKITFVVSWIMFIKLCSGQDANIRLKQGVLVGVSHFTIITCSI